MKNTWIILSCAGMLAACSRPAIPGTTAAHVPNGYYYGSDGLFTTVFVKLVSDTAIGGLIWSQYIHAALGGDALYAPKQEPRTLRGLYQLALESGVAAYNLTSRRIKDARVKIHSLEKVLQSAIDAHFEGDVSALENYFRVGAIEATALIKAAAKAISGASCG